MCEISWKNEIPPTLPKGGWLLNDGKQVREISTEQVRQLTSLGTLIERGFICLTLGCQED